MADCCLSRLYVSENLNGRFIPGSSHLPDSESSGWSVPEADIECAEHLVIVIPVNCTNAGGGRML